MTTPRSNCITSSIAGYIVYAELGSIVQQLTSHPEVRAKLAAEIASKAPSGPLSLETLMAMPYLLQVVNEVKRLCPIVPAVSAKRKRRASRRVSVPAGWMVMWAVTPSHGRAERVHESDCIRSRSFLAGARRGQTSRARLRAAGAGPATGHRCPGLDSRRTSWKSSRLVLLRGYTWELPPQNYESRFQQDAAGAEGRVAGVGCARSDVRVA